uniref:Uncharacterized protein n=1 Tax=Tetradesmus obliquus TaxID=3088 RepID=A0A383W1L2_TETOB
MHNLHARQGTHVRAANPGRWIYTCTKLVTADSRLPRLHPLTWMPSCQGSSSASSSMQASSQQYDSLLVHNNLTVNNSLGRVDSAG